MIQPSAALPASTADPAPAAGPASPNGAVDPLNRRLADAAALAGLLVFLHPLALPFSSASLAASCMYAGLGLLAAVFIRATSRLDAQGGAALTFTAPAGAVALIVTAGFGVLLLPSFALWFATTTRLLHPGNPTRVARAVLGLALLATVGWLLLAILLA